MLDESDADSIEVINPERPAVNEALRKRTPWPG